MRHKTLGLFTLAAALIGGVWWWTAPPREPRCKGILLAHWLETHDDFVPSSGWPINGLGDEKANAKMQATGEKRRRALHTVGPSTVRWLIYALEHGRQIGEPPPQPSGPAWLQWVHRHLFHHAPPSWADYQMNTAEALGWMGPDAAPAIPALAKMLDSSDETLVQYCADSLNRIGPLAMPAVEDRLAHARELARFHLVSTLAHQLHHPPHRPTDRDVTRVIAVLVGSCRDTYKIRTDAINQLRNWEPIPGTSPRANEVLPGFIGLLHERNSPLRARIADILEDYCTAAEAAIPALIEILDDPDPQARAAAARALRAIDTREQRSAARLRRMVDDPDPNCQCDAMRALETFAEPPDE